ncbi:plasmid partitioning protein RepB [Ensifer adhaerens]|uniref:plasmid partitioning protein RepB n=1 Tax=Ensifer adhaerens TaxID=106592 RepID=UPI0008073A07|nr:plasmid partitioning protein RepB [Ensifer adhaerens]
MSKSSRKSIVANFGLLSQELENKLADDPQPAPPAPSPRVGAGVVGAAHRAIDDIKAERDRLKAIVEAGGGTILDLNPAFIDPSPYPDRLPDDDAGDFETFKRSIESEGQKVPIQVRRHPSSKGRYQIVYGHRRWRAAKELGRTVRALEVEISDLDLVVAQGIENASRQDLTWIERTLFASRMDDAGIKARNIYAALSIADAELARMRGVYRSIPADVIEAIGRAPKVGRPRWIEFAKTIASDPGSLAVVRQVLTDAGDGVSVSDQRFQRAFEAIKPSTQPREDRNELAASDGMKLGAWKMSPKELRISADGPLGLEFVKFVGKELPALIERFSREREN